MLKVTILFALLLTVAFGNLVDYLKGTNRSFNVLEGKVPKLSVEMDPKDYEKLVSFSQINQEEDIIIGCNLDATCLEKYETKVKLTFEVDGEKKVFEKVNIKTGGNFGRANDRIGFNFKLKGDDRLLDLKQFRIRPDAGDASHLKSKIALDLLNKWGLPSIQETYVEFYLNGEYFGLYFLQDALKANWIRKQYNLPETEEVETLFYCRKDGVNLVKGDECIQQNEKIANYTEPLEELFEKIEGAKTVEDLEKFMNVDLLMKNLAIEFLFGSFDHYVIQGHNFYMYQKKDGEWDMILVDFDAEFGSALYIFTTFVLQYPNVPELGYKFRLDDMPKPGKKLLDSAYFNDKTYFKQALRELMITGFTPDVLFKRIDEIKDFIAPYVKKSVTLREDGRLPGTINLRGTDNTHTYEDFLLECESEEATNPMSPTIKAWIKHRFDFACEEYGFDKEEILREAAEYRGEKYIPSAEPKTETEEAPKPTTTVYKTTTVVRHQPTETETEAAEDVDADVDSAVDSADEVDADVDNEEDSADEKSADEE